MKEISDFNPHAPVSVMAIGPGYGAGMVGPLAVKEVKR